MTVKDCVIGFAGAAWGFAAGCCAVSVNGRSTAATLERRMGFMVLPGRETAKVRGICEVGNPARSAQWPRTGPARSSRLATELGDRGQHEFPELDLGPLRLKSDPAAIGG